VTVALTAKQRGELRRRVRAVSGSQRDAVRARIILACEIGDRAADIAQGLGMHARTVARWRARFVRHGLAGLQDMARSGPKPKFGPVARLELIALACEPGPAAGQRTRTIGDLTQLAHALVTVLGPYLARPDLSDRKSGSDH